MSIEARVCYVPFNPAETWRPPPPTAKSWRFLKEHANVKGVRLQYLYDDPRWWPSALLAATDGGMEIHGNFCLANLKDAVPSPVFESEVSDWVRAYGSRMESVSFANEVGYDFGDTDISKGGSRDYMKELVDNFWLPFIRGVRRANPSIIIGGPDAESADTLQRFVDLVDVDQWFVHPYGEEEIADDGDLDYATMAGENGKPGFISVTAPLSLDHPVRRQLIISEIDHQQHKAARARGEQRGIATDAEIDLLTAFSIRMRDDFHAPVVTFGTGEYFCTRVPVFPWIKPEQTWSTWTYGEPEMSDAGRRLANVFAPQVADGRRRAVGRIV